MVIAQLVEQAHTLGAAFRVVGGKVQLAAPVQLPPELMAELRENKDGIAAHLTDADRCLACTCDDAIPRPRPRCPLCQSMTCADCGQCTVSPQKRDRPQLLAWASELANQDAILVSPVRFNETPLRPLTTTRISFYARRYLRTVAAAELARHGLTWEPWTVEWHEDRAREAIESLENLRASLAFSVPPDLHGAHQ
jgi:hypothetical protein